MPTVTSPWVPLPSSLTSFQRLSGGFAPVSKVAPPGGSLQQQRTQGAEDVPGSSLLRTAAPQMPGTGPASISSSLKVPVDSAFSEGPDP